MATVLRNVSPDVAPFVTAFNDLKAQIGAGSHFHLDASEMTITAADATDLPTSLTLVNQMRALSLFARADTLAHKAADTATITAPAATTLATAITLANELKADHNTHCGSTSWHYNADSSNTVATTDASTTQGQLDTLLNALKAAINLHMADAPAAHSLRLVDA